MGTQYSRNHDMGLKLKLERFAVFSIGDGVSVCSKANSETVLAVASFGNSSMVVFVGEL